MIKHIVFDFDGTIADSAHLGLQILNEFSEKYNYKKLTVDEWQTLNNMPIKERFRLIGLPLYRLPQASVEGLARYRQLIGSLKAFDGMKELLLALKANGLCLSIVSSNSVENIKSFLQKNKLEVFDNIISANNLFGKHKSIKKVLKQFNLGVAEVIYIGDELRDIEACKKISVKIISVAWGLDSLDLLKGGKPDYIAYKPHDIIEIIKGIAG
ncbi:MAG: HAD-IA family hydrolase [Clostridia bacterium]|nr:HAD-IA family hydrolase [Clostridia bacterium]